MMSSPKYKVSVIIAVYNAADTIDRCARSLFGQTLEDVEFIFVDDCSPDKSIANLKQTAKDFPHKQFKIISHKTNQGVAAARTTGMKAAQGKYIIHCDPDDWMELTTLERSYEAAEKYNTDILTFGYREIKRNSTAEYRPTFEGSGLEALLKWQFSFTLWNCLVRRDLIAKNEIYPFDGINSGEDTNVMMRAYALSKKVKSINDILYNYDRTISDSITTQKFKINFERNIIPNISRLDMWFKEHNLPDSIMLTFKAKMKGEVLFRDGMHNASLAIKMWPEANTLWCNMPEYSTTTRLILKAGVICPLLLQIYIRLRTHGK